MLVDGTLPYSIPPNEMAALQAAIDGRYELGHLQELEVADDDRVYAVLDGWLYLYDTFENGSWAVIRHVAPGEFFAPTSSAESERPLYVAALGHAEVVAFCSEKLADAVKAKATRRLWLQAQRLERRDLVSWLAVALCGSGTAKLSFLLHSLGRRWGRTHPDWAGTYPFPATQDHLGAATGLTAVHVNRCLQRLRGEGVLDLHKGVVKIQDPGHLPQLG